MSNWLHNSHLKCLFKAIPNSFQSFLCWLGCCWVSFSLNTDECFLLGYDLMQEKPLVRTHAHTLYITYSHTVLRDRSIWRLEQKLLYSQSSEWLMVHRLQPNGQTLLCNTGTGTEIKALFTHEVAEVTPRSWSGIKSKPIISVIIQIWS